MGKIREDLNGGLVDGSDPAWLEPGQLSYIQNCTYVPSSPALYRARGRATFGTATAAGGGATHVAGDVNGLRDMDFDNSAGHYLIAQVSGSIPAYVTAFVGDTGTFGILTQNMTAGSALEVVQHNNRFFLFNGVSRDASAINSNGVVYLSSTAASSAPIIRQHGLLPVTTPPATATAAAAFSITDTGASGFYEYWTTEVFKGTQDGAQFEIESTYAANAFSSAKASAATVYVSAVGSVAPVISMPAQVNTNATHWRVYRSTKKQFSTDVAFPIGFRVADVAITATVTSVIDTSTSTVGTYYLPTAVNVSPAPFSDWGNPTGATSVGNTSASALNTLVTSNWGGTVRKNSQAYYGFNSNSGAYFGGFKGPVQGIEVEMLVTGPTNLQVTLTKRKSDGNVDYGVFGQRGATVTGTNQTITVGGSADRWSVGRPFSDTDFDGNFMCVIMADNVATFDYVKVRPYYGAADSAPVDIFHNVVYTFGDIVAQVGRDGPPPCASTGDLYEDCLVVNDVTNPSLIRYSSPGLPESFPATYFLDFETRDNDVVKWIKVVNNRLLVALNNSVWRVNYLPSERDASFDRGKAIEPLTQSYGAVNAMCVCTFSQDSTTQLLAWVSQKGVHITDGFSFETLTDSINWRGILSLTSTSEPIALVNDPENKIFKFLYRNDANTESYKELHFSYAEKHSSRRSDLAATNASLKIAGQVNMRNYESVSTSAANPRSMWAVPRTNGDTSVYYGYGSATAASGGMVFRETGNTIPAQDPNMGFKTRRWYIAGEGKEVEIHTVYGYLGSYSGSPGINVTAQNCKTNDDGGERVVAGNTVQYTGRKLGKWQMRAMTEGLVLSAAVTGNPNQALAWDYLLVEGEDFGDEDSGK